MLNELLQRLYARRRFGMRPGLERMEALLGHLGNPERELAAVHIAGTNGKGSVSAMCAAVLRAAGLHVGCFTSPHLLRFNERICVNGEPAADAELLAALVAVEEAMGADDEARNATFFECAAAAAFVLFRQRGLRLAVVEAGLGGRLDATNVLTPLLAVITRIGLEHCEYLGNTIEAIAGEKAGIVKPGRPVVLGAMPSAARDTIAAVAAHRGAPLIDAAQTVAVTARLAGFEGLEAKIADDQRDLGKVRLGVAGAYQLENVATAVAALEVWSQTTGLALPDLAFKQGLEQVRWPARFQLVRRDPPVIVDGAHNPDAAAALALALRRGRFKGPMGLVAGFCDDKDVQGFLRALAPLMRRAWAVATPSPRSLPAAATAAAMRRAGLEAVPADTLAAALADGEVWAGREQGALLVCGSLFLAGEALRHYDALPWKLDGVAVIDPNEQLRPGQAK